MKQWDNPENAIKKAAIVFLNTIAAFALFLIILFCFASNA
jgi:hypothetical protein